MQKIKEAFDCKGDCKLKSKFGKKFENLEKALLGGDGHDLKPHGKSNLIGGDGHDLKPHGKSNLIGGDGHDLKHHGKSNLIGGDGHDLKPHGKSNLLGGDGHDLKPHGNSAPEDGGSFGLLLNGSPMLNGDVGDLCQWGVFQQFQERFKRLYMSKQGTWMFHAESY